MVEKFCKECGQKFNEKEMLIVGRKFYCKDCAQDVMKESHSHSSINIVNTNSMDSGEFSNGKRIVTRNHIVGVVLSVLFGWLGADRFYANHVGLGILKLLTFGGYGIWWIIDIILFATRNVNYVKWE